MTRRLSKLVDRIMFVQFNPHMREFLRQWHNNRNMVGTEFDVQALLNEVAWLRTENDGLRAEAVLA